MSFSLDLVLLNNASYNLSEKIFKKTNFVLNRRQITIISALSTDDTEATLWGIVSRYEKIRTSEIKSGLKRF